MVGSHGSRAGRRSGRGRVRHAGARASPTATATAALVEALAPFGFAEYDARAYAALLAGQPATAYEVAKRAGIPDSKIYRALEKLEGRGIVTAVRRDPAIFAALPPEVLAATLEAVARRSLRAVRGALERVEARESPVAAWSLEHGTAVLDRASALLTAARSRVEIACGSGPLAALAGALAAARERGVQVALAPAGPGPDGAGREAVTLLADSSEALVARLGTAPDGRIEGHGLASREPALVAAVAELLERRRAEAEAVSPAAPARRTGTGPARGGGRLRTALGALEAALAPGRLDIC